MLPLLLAGLAVSRYADMEAEARRQKLLMAMRAYGRGQAQVGQAATENLLAQQTPQARASELAAVTADRSKSLGDTVAAAQTTSPVLAGKLSGDYVRSQETAANTVAERTRRAIEQLSSMGAPGEQALKSGIRFGRAAGDVDASNSAIGNVSNAYMGDIKGTVANPALKLAGSAMMAYGGAKMGMPTATDQPEQLSGPGYDEPTTNGAKVRRAFSIWGRKSN
jgi:hypothetical protein